jgi:hypothetical protein
MQDRLSNRNQSMDKTTHKTYQSPKESNTFKYLFIGFTVFGLYFVLAGTINFFIYLSSGFLIIHLVDIAFNIVFGILLYTCSRLLAKGRELVIWLFGGTIIFSMIYILAMRYSFNILIVLVEVSALWQLIRVREQGKLS